MRILAEMHIFGNPSAKLKIVGVTGTNGKTTTSTLLYRIATELGYKAGLIGTVENIVAGERRETTFTTPGTMALNKLLNEMVNKGCEYVFMEVSSHGLDQGRVAGINFTGGIFTNLTHDHLDYHQNFENYFFAKKKLFDSLPTGSFALSNADDDHGKKMLEGTKADRYLYEFKNIEGPATLDKKFQGEIVKMDFSGIELKINGTQIKSRLIGKFNAYNLLAVWSACKLLGFDMSRVNKTLENIDPPAGRFQYFKSSDDVLVVVDYAHTPDALENVLQAVKISFPGSKIISVFGCGGDRDPTKRSKMGKIGAELSDITIFTSDNPRSEDPEKIIKQMKTELTPELEQKIKTIPDRRDAIREAIRLAQKGDIVLVAGKGHENYQEIKGVKHHFDDLEELKRLL